MEIPTPLESHQIECQDCVKMIPYKNYSAHVYLKHKKNRKPCPICHLGFSTSYLRAHISNTHEVQPPESRERKQKVSNVFREKCASKRKLNPNNASRNDGSSENDFRTSECGYFIPKGYRLIDFNIFNSALKKAQRCGHQNLALTEIQNEGCLASMLAFLCCSCGAKTLFPNSYFSKKRISNYDYEVNKVMLPLLGAEGFSSFSKYVLETDDDVKVETNEQRNDDIEFVKGDFEGEVNITCEPTTVNVKQEPIEEVKEEIEVKVEFEETSENEIMDSKNIKLERDLVPKMETEDGTITVPDGILTPIPTGTKITNTKIERSTTDTYKVPPGVYRYIRSSDKPETVIIIKDKQAGNFTSKKGKAVLKKTPHVRTALQLFSCEKEMELSAKFPNHKPQEISNMIVNKWISLSEEEKAVYKKKVFENVTIKTSETSKLYTFTA